MSLCFAKIQASGTSFLYLRGFAFELGEHLYLSCGYTEKKFSAFVARDDEILPIAERPGLLELEFARTTRDKRGAFAALDQYPAPGSGKDEGNDQE